MVTIPVKPAVFLTPPVGGHSTKNTKFWMIAQSDSGKPKSDTCSHGWHRYTRIAGIRRFATTLQMVFENTEGCLLRIDIPLLSILF